MKLLDQDQIAKRLKSLPDSWFISAKKLNSVFEFDSVDMAKDFINCVIIQAEKINHHPQLTWTYKKVELSVQTHEVGGLTKLDFDFAKAASRCASKN